MKKYSKYNVYQGCATMHSLSEAIKLVSELSTATGDPVGELAKIESKVALYKEYFYGFGNTVEQEKEYQTAKKEMLSSLSADDEAFTELVAKETADNTADAMFEFQERLNSIDKRSKAGADEGAEAFDLRVLESKRGTRYGKTCFTKLTNACIGLDYRCSDRGVYRFNKYEMDYVRVCDAVSIKSLLFDDVANQQYIEIEYYDYGKVKSVCFEASHLATSTYSDLMKLGIVIDSPKLFTAYLNDLRSVDKEVPTITKGKANMYYGYTKNEDGSLNFDVFIGIDDGHKIIPLPEYANLDCSIFKKKGTVEGFKKFLSEVSKGHYTIDFQMVVSASLSGVVQAYVNNGMNIVAPPSYIFVGRTSIGKGLLGAIANNVWCKPDAVSLICSSDSSNAFMYAAKHRIQYLPFILADIQDLLNRKDKDVNTIADIVFLHSNGVSGGKSTITGEIRNNMRFWQCPLIAFNEADVFTGNAKITGGADARFTILDLKVAPEHRYITEKSPQSYLALENANYAVLGEAFVLAMRNKTPEAVAERFIEITRELEALGVQEKQANSLGMLVLADELAKSFGLLPTEWEALSCKRLVEWNGVKEITDPTETIYNLLSEYVVKDPSYVPVDDVMFTKNPYGQTEQQVFDLRMKTEREVRGRILYECKDKNGEWISCQKALRERTLLLIPSLQLEQLLNHLTKESEIQAFGFDKKRWVQNGWLMKNDGGYTFKGKHKVGITRPYDSKNREYYYVILLKENGSDD